MYTSAYISLLCLNVLFRLIANTGFACIGLAIVPIFNVSLSNVAAMKGLGKGVGVSAIIFMMFFGFVMGILVIAFFNQVTGSLVWAFIVQLFIYCLLPVFAILYREMIRETATSYIKNVYSGGCCCPNIYCDCALNKCSKCD